MGKTHTHTHTHTLKNIGACPPLPTPFFLSLCRRVVTLAQTRISSSRSSPSDGYSPSRRHTPTSPNIWRKGQKWHVISGDSLCFTGSTFIPHASPSLQTEEGACEHPTAPFARPGVCTISASYWEGNRVRGTGRSEWGRGWDWSRGRERRR